MHTLDTRTIEVAAVAIAAYNAHRIALRLELEGRFQQVSTQLAATTRERETAETGRQRRLAGKTERTLRTEAADLALAMGEAAPVTDEERAAAERFASTRSIPVARLRDWADGSVEREQELLELGRAAVRSSW